VTYLAQIDVPCDVAARLPLRDTYASHKLMWKCFPGFVPDPSKGRFPKGMKPQDQPKIPADWLMRIDERRGAFRVLIVSRIEPSRPSWCPAECWKSRLIPESYFQHRRYRFQLCANPTKKVTKVSPDGSAATNGRRVPLCEREELIEWIKRKGDQGGFAVDVARLRTFSRGREYFVRHGQEGLHSAVEFEGVLTVTDPPRFHETFTRGIGSAKAFGFGLLVIAPAGE
jgi:CRISPR system Cascade subunit CasE